MRLWISIFLCLSIISMNTVFASAEKIDRTEFYTYQQMKNVLHQYEVRYPNLISVHELAKTQGGRNVILLKIGKNDTENPKPSMLAIFGQHADEHETTNMAMGFTKKLLESYGTDTALTSMLDNSTIYIIPMANPDGIDYDLSSDSTFTTWRKNRVPTSNGNYGVDLNRNWGYCWDAATPKDLDQKINDPADEDYHGKSCFSEAETKGISKFISSHKDQLKFLLDYHTGRSGFMQGFVLVPYCYTEEQYLPEAAQQQYKSIGSNLCSLISDDTDKRKNYNAIRAYEVKNYVLSSAPLELRSFIEPLLPASTVAPGAAIDWTASQGIMSFGIEADCSTGMVEKDAAAREKLIQHQFNGFIYILRQLTTK